MEDISGAILTEEILQEGFKKIWESNKKVPKIIENPMPPKPLEAILEEAEELEKYLGVDPEMDMTPEYLGMGSFVRMIWEQALRYGASVLEDEKIALEESLDIELDMDTRHNAAVEDCKTALLEEADKAVKGV